MRTFVEPHRLPRHTHRESGRCFGVREVSSLERPLWQGHYVAVADERVLGVDACRAGWLGIALGPGQVTAYTAARIDQLVAAVQTDGRVEVVAIDMPIGLSPMRDRAAPTGWPGPRSAPVGGRCS
jgi:hypothetical protein